MAGGGVADCDCRCVDAFVAKAVLAVPDQEAFVQEMAGHYQEMLRQHLADPSVGSGPADGTGSSPGDG